MLGCNHVGALWHLDNGFTLLIWKMKIVDQGLQGLTTSQQTS
jgi:hypothetical protein